MKLSKRNTFWLAASLTFAGLAMLGGMFISPKSADLASLGVALAAPKAFPAMASKPDPRLGSAYRFDKGGWIYVHLSGSPEQIGFQHGSLLAEEIQDAFEAVKLDDTHMTQRDWEFFRRAAREMLWPKIEPEYQEELKGIVAGLKSKGKTLDIDDVVALNAFEELPDYYVPWYNTQHKEARAPRLFSPGNCSAFVATGSYTRDHKIVIAHNNWTNYMNGERWRIIFDIVPQRGAQILMDGFPGVITSDDDFGVNSNGIMITETTITGFEGWDPKGKPEFERSRKALQYSNSIDDYVRIMLDGNNGGYANDWLLADNKTGEIAQFELGLKAHKVWRTKDGYFVGSNWPRDPEVIRLDTNFDSKDLASSPNARRTRWEELMKGSKGKIDVQMAEQFLSDHVDAYEKKKVADERTLCGHVDTCPRGISVWGWDGYYPGGAVQGKAMDSQMAKSLSFYARRGHPCGEDFIAAPFLKAHPEYSWMAPKLLDMKAGPWTQFKAGQRQ
jgi:Phospholipase B